MNLKSVTSAHVGHLMQWFPDRGSCHFWSGPEFRFPYTETTFREDIRLELPSFALIDGDEQLMGFGQYYLRVGRCHLARLAISPLHRGRAIGATLIHELSLVGRNRLQVSECSLFVLPDNARAIRLYTRLGFTPTPYPEDPSQFEPSIYMVASPSVVDTWDGAHHAARLGRQ